MKSMRGSLLATFIFTFAILGSMNVANADYDALYKALWLAGYDTNIYSGHGFQRDILGNGYQFTAVAPYGSDVFRLCGANLTLGNTVTLTAGYTNRCVPTARFSMSTNANTPLTYTLTNPLGFNTYTATGQMQININTQINALGFYSEEFYISNRGTYTQRGSLTDAIDVPLDFDSGPIVVSGNIFTDLAALIAEPIFDAAGTDNPLAQLSPWAKMWERQAKTVEVLGDDAEMGPLSVEAFTTQEIGRQINNTILATLLGQEPGTNLFDSLVLPEPLLEILAEGTFAPDVLLTPEPSSLLLLAFAVPVFWRRQRYHG